MIAQFTQFLKSSGPLSYDITSLAVVFLFFFFATVWLGRNRTISFILAYYPSLFLFANFPFTNKLIFISGGVLGLVNHIGVFLVFLLPISIVINRFVFAESEYSGSYHLIRTGGLALICTLLVVIFSYTVIDLSLIHDFSNQIDTLFSTESRVFWLNLLPLAIFAFL